MNIVERYYELADDNITGKERVKIISQEFPEIGTRLKNSCNPLDRLRGIIRSERKKGESIEKLNNETENHYELESDNIIFYQKKKDKYGETYKEKVEIPFDYVCAVCYDYTYGGLSGAKVQRKHIIKPQVWNLLKSRLFITKDSNALPDVVLDYIAEHYGEEAVEEKIQEVSYKAVHDKYRGRFIKQWEKSKERLDDEVRKSFATNENYLQHLNSFLKDYTPEKIVFPRFRKNNCKEETFVITDLHIGKTGTDKVLERVAFVTNKAIESEAEKINILCLGDLGECFVEGGMHSGQVEHMDGPFGFDLMLKVVEVLKEMIAKIGETKEVYFHGLTGNHGRIAKGHDQDHSRTAELVIYELLSKSFDEHVITYYRKDWNTTVLDTIGYILHHGDDRATSKRTENIILEQSVEAKHKIVLMGDKHHLYMKDESSTVTRVIAPALAGKGEYDTRLGLSSYAGFLRITKNEFGMPDIQTVRIP